MKSNASKYAQDVLGNSNRCGKMEDAMDMIQLMKKCLQQYRKVLHL